MSELGELYQQMVLDHNKSPRNYRKLKDANRSAEGYNPLCGDILSVDIKMADGVIQEIGFQGAGCAISRASASIMTEAVRGKTREEAVRMFQAFHEVVTGRRDPLEAMDELGKLGYLTGVRDFPARVKCATLAWHTLRGALEGAKKPVSTE